MSQNLVLENTIPSLVARQAKRYGKREFLRYGKVPKSIADQILRLARGFVPEF